MAGEYDEHMLMNLGLHFPQPQVFGSVYRNEAMSIGRVEAMMVRRGRGTPSSHAPFRFKTLA